MGRRRDSAIIVAGVVVLSSGAAGLGLWAWSSRAPAPPPPAEDEPQPSAPAAPEPAPVDVPVPRPRPPSPLPWRPPASDPRDVEALARMLASEDGRRAVRIVVGWFAMEHARRAKRSIFSLLTGRSGEYGPQVHAGEVRYSATTKPATADSYALAQQLLAGQVEPSQEIRAHGVSAWVEQGVSGYTALRILSRQLHQTGKQAGKVDFGGIWGRLQGTRWYLYSGKSPIIGENATTEEGAAQVLASVPEVPPLDETAA